MSESPSYFDDPRHAKKFHDEAITWLGTPFHPYHQDKLEAARAQLQELGMDIDKMDIKGPGGGIDCIGLVQEIFYRSGATDKWMFPRSPADYQSNQLGEKVLDWLRGRAVIGNDEIGYSIEPQSEKLGQIFVELEVPESVTDHDGETPRDFFKPGDILVMQRRSLFHLPVIIDHDLHFVNALPRLGVIEGTIQDSSYSDHLVAVFRLLPLSSRAKSRDL